MTDPITTVGTAATAVALAKLLDSEIIKNLLAPVTQQAGLMAGDLAGIVRTYTTFNLAQVLTKLAKQRQNKPLQTAEFIRVIPLLQAASMVSDEELQERWAALLEGSVSEPEDVLPSFGQTLSQLTAEEARFLEQLHERRQEMGEFSRLERIYDPMLPHTYGDEGDKKRGHLRLMIQDFDRLGLLTGVQRFKAVGQPYSQHELANYLDKLGKQELKCEYELSVYGFKFIKAVTPKR